MVLFGLVLMLACATIDARKSREWYCKIESDSYQICHNTNSAKGESKPPKECKCENMQFVKNDGSFQLYGGPEQCNDPDDKFCFVSVDSICEDIDYSSVNERLENINIWSDKEIWYSYEACNAKEQDDRTGNEELLQGVKILDDYIKIADDKGRVSDDSENIQFFYDDYEECQDECMTRQGNCGAWSFDDEEGICYIHTVDSCCGQMGKRERNSTWISGYACHKCWSTKKDTDCPCSQEERQEVPNTAHGAGGRAPLHATSSGSLTVASNKAGRNLCKCVPKKTRRGRVRCKKPFCVGPKEIGCKDLRKCRRRKKGKRRGRSLLDFL